MTRIIAMAQHKGGTGKTTTTLNLAFGLQQLGRNVLMVDMDAQANLTESVIDYREGISMYEYMTMRVKQPVPVKIKDRLYLLPSSIDLAGAETEINAVPNRDQILSRILQKFPGFDYILIDCPPSLGVLALNALMAADEVIVPMQAEVLPMKGLVRLMEVLEQIREMSDKTVDVSGILITMVQDTVLNRDLTAELRARYNGKVLPGVIRRNIAISEAVLSKSSVFDYAPDSNGAKDYRDLVEWVIGREKLWRNQQG